MLKKLCRDRKGQGLVEYALLIAGVGLISAAGVSLFGHKTSDLIATMAAVLPGAHLDDNAPVQSGHLIETAPVGTNGAEALDIATILSQNGTDRLGMNVMGPTSPGAGNGVGGLVIESE